MQCWRPRERGSSDSYMSGATGQKGTRGAVHTRSLPTLGSQPGRAPSGEREIGSRGFLRWKGGLNSALQSEQRTRKLEGNSGERVEQHTATPAQRRSCSSPFPPRVTWSPQASLLTAPQLHTWTPQDPCTPCPSWLRGADNSPFPWSNRNKGGIFPKALYWESNGKTTPEIKTTKTKKQMGRRG